MVLWEMTAITAYFLGLKRTYKIALRIQRRLIGPNHPKIRDFVHRRTRDVFNVAVKVHKNIQDRDLEAGRNLGSWILRLLDRMKPSAQIRPHHHPPNGPDRIKRISAARFKKPRMDFKAQEGSSDGGRALFTPLSSLGFRRKPSSMINVNIMRQANQTGINNSSSSSSSSLFRRVSYFPSCNLSSLSRNLGVDRRRVLLEGVFRKDIARLMVQ